MQERRVKPSQRSKRGYVFYNHRQGTPVLFMAITVLIATLVVFGAVILLKNSVKLSSVKIEGQTRYSVEQILGAGEMSMGDKLFKIDLDATEEKILKGCTYIAEISLKRRMSGKLVLEIKESEPRYYLQSGDSAFVVDGEFRLLEITDDLLSIAQMGFIKVSATNLSYTQVGSPIKFDEEVGLSCEDVLSVLSEIESFKYENDVNFVSFDDKYNLYFTCGDRFKVILGDSKEISSKLNSASRAIDSYYDSPQNSWVINVSDPQKSVVGTR